MMKTWTKVLPFIFIEWYSKKYLGVYLINVVGLHKHRVAVPFKGVFIEVK